MKRNIVVVTGALMLSAAVAQGQGGQHCQYASLNSACETAADVFVYMAPQVGQAIAGGNATLGQGGSLGGLGHFAVSVRGNVVRGSLPDLSNYSPATQGPTTIDTKDQFLGLPTVDAAIGIFPGLNLGVTRVGGIDALLNAAYIPEYDGGSVKVKLPNGSLKFGYGARIGILQEGIVSPGVGFSYVRRDLPTMDITATTSAGTLEVHDISVKTTSWRVTASKSLILFGLAVGAGQDKYDASGTIGIIGAPSTSGPSYPSQSLTRTNYFADLSMNLMLAKLVAEIGQVSGGDVQTYNTFSGKAADASRLYGSVGLRVGF
ncbi:MAG: hypothetical protein HOQ11_14165 [Gemmatimonadaceae bacterium]|nr:hypothetical protein [Gemmatimonadaceae bacterium]NUQ94392.1 hypothetical protein [Gemmatimonadaceae bacterium]NUR19202.1 hypothetical protein [Gemmatimonadaceae bacterium]NUS98546.1 hypothetical protein [Gemmatimonadaceae bacterium]